VLIHGLERGDFDWRDILREEKAKNTVLHGIETQFT
jgi:hypothetical protein